MFIFSKRWKTVEYDDVMVRPFAVGALKSDPQWLELEIGGFRDQRKNQDQPNHDTVKIS